MKKLWCFVMMVMVFVGAVNVYAATGDMNSSSDNYTETASYTFHDSSALKMSCVFTHRVNVQYKDNQYVDQITISGTFSLGTKTNCTAALDGTSWDREGNTAYHKGNIVMKSYNEKKWVIAVPKTTFTLDTDGTKYSHVTVYTVARNE